MIDKFSKVTITTTSFAEYDKSPLKLIEKNKYEVILNPYGRKLKKDEVIEFCKDSVGIIAGTEIYDAEVLETLSKSSALSPRSSLKVISRCGTGLDNVDLDVAKRLGIKVFNTPDAPTLAVAELTIGLILDLLRKVSQMDREIRIGQWQKRMGNLLSGRKVGIIGFGRIGQKIACLLKPFGCEVKYYDIKTEIKGLKTGRVGLDELLKISDIITVHVSSKEQIIGHDNIKLMKEGSWIVNVSRGGAVDENVLYTALKNGLLAGAALDVFDQEPYNGPLKELENVILTPHIGSYAKESRNAMETEAVDNLLKGLEMVE